MANLDKRNQPPQQSGDGFRAETNSSAPRGDEAVVRVFHSLILRELARSGESASGTGPARTDITSADVSSFCDLLARPDVCEAMDFVTEALGRGADYDSILLDLLAGAARQMGVNWEKDECSFSDVTIGMSRLQQVLQQLALNAPFHPGQLQTRGRVLLAPCPGEQHNFGIMLLDNMFHRAGWELRTLPGASDNQLTRIVADSRFDVVGLSLSCDEQLPKLEKAISAIRRESRNERIIVLVGGRVFADDSSLATRIGADAGPPSAAAALLAAEALMDARVREASEQEVASR
jgi:methanogenic corrinoid protein MtbC1